MLLKGEIISRFWWIISTRLKISLAVLLLLGVLVVAVYAAASSLVYLDGGRLVYVPFANEGQTNADNIIPDFSYAGYKGGGVALPHVPVVQTVEADTGDMRPVIQAAIDNVSDLPLDGDGFRGAILLKAGRYEIDGPLYIRKSGIVLRGEDQNAADAGGTELVATARYQHTLIQFEGKEENLGVAEETQLDTRLYPGLNQWVGFNAAAGVADELTTDGVITFRLVSDLNKLAWFASKEDSLQEHHPRLVVTVTTSAGGDSLISLFPTDDTYIKGQDNSNTAFGDEASIVVKYRPSNPRVHRESFLKFELSALPNDIKDAELQLYTVNKDDTGGVPNNLILYHSKDDDWNESQFTWDIYFSKQQGPAYIPQRITSYIPSGVNSFDVEDASVFSVGDTIHVTRTPNDNWINTLDMAQYGWTAGSYKIDYERVIKSITGNTIEVYVPLVQAIEDTFGGGEVKKVSIGGRIQDCGIENMFITSVYAYDEDENHGWNAIQFSESDNCWARNVTARYFAYSCVHLSWAYHTTIEECAMLDPKSKTEGGRKYSFKIDKGSFNLLQRCFTRNGRHDYVAGSRVAGPNVFVDCESIETHADIGPHSRYTTGMLFDNVKGGQIRVQDRKDKGTGHGWAGAQVMLWNNYSFKEDIKVESPIGAKNWGIGCIGQEQQGAGFWESWGAHVTPRSLYYQQLEDRLGTAAVENVTTPEQRGNEPIWSVLENWAGIGNLSKFPTSVVEQDILPDKITLFQNYPNPFNPETSIGFSIAQSNKVQIIIYNILGEKIRTLVNRTFTQGMHSAKWDGTNEQGHQTPSGVYFYRMKIGTNIEVKKMMLVR